MNSVVFVCTGNIFRSMTAEWALKSYLGSNQLLQVSSAGIEAKQQLMNPVVKQRLQSYGIDPSPHVQTRLTPELIRQTDLMVAMGENHQDVMFSKFDHLAPLFLEVCYGTTEPILDIHEALPDWLEFPELADSYAVSVVDRIVESIPDFIKKFPDYIEAKNKPEPSDV